MVLDVFDSIMMRALTRKEEERRRVVGLSPKFNDQIKTHKHVYP